MSNRVTVIRCQLISRSLPTGGYTRYSTPDYHISIDELNLDKIWYTLDGGITNYTITSLKGTINQTAWESLSEGSVTLRFYVNDTSGNVGLIDLELQFDISVQSTISVGHFYIIFMLIGILAVVILKKHDSKNDL